MGWCWRRYGLQRRGGGAKCSASEVFDGLVTRYGGAAANEVGSDHLLPLCGHCMFTMMMRVHAHGFLAKYNLGVFPISYLGKASQHSAWRTILISDPSAVMGLPGFSLPVRSTYPNAVRKEIAYVPEPYLS